MDTALMGSSKGGSSGGTSSTSAADPSLENLLSHHDASIANTANEATLYVPSERIKEPVQTLLRSLVEERAGLPDKDDRLSAIDASIIPLTNLVRMMYGGGPYEVAHESAPAPPSPERQGIAAGHLLQDLSEANLLHEASDYLGMKHLSDANGPLAWPLMGLLYGPCRRPLLCLPTAIGGRSYKHVIFLVDTGAPITELSPHAFEALLGGAAQAIPTSTSAKLNGQQHQVYLCAPGGNHPDIPVLGADAMAALGLELRVN